MSLNQIISLLKVEAEKENKYILDGPGNKQEKVVIKENNKDKEENSNKESEKVKDSENNELENNKEKVKETEKENNDTSGYLVEIERLKAIIDNKEKEEVAKRYSISVEDLELFSGSTLKEKEENIKAIFEKVEKQGYKITENSSLNDKNIEDDFNVDDVVIKSF